MMRCADIGGGGGGKGVGQEASCCWRSSIEAVKM